MRTFKDEGIILKRHNSGERDRLLTVFTRNHGKMRLLAKGVRRIASRRAPHLELLNSVTFSATAGHSLDLVCEVESHQTFGLVKEHLERVGYGYYVIELVDGLTAEHQPHPEVFNLLVTILTVLTNNPRKVAVHAFAVRLLSLLGFWSLVSLERADPKVRQILATFSEGDWQAILALELSSELDESLEVMLHAYIEEILERKLRSPRLIAQIRNGRYNSL